MQFQPVFCCFFKRRLVIFDAMATHYSLQLRELTITWIHVIVPFWWGRQHVHICAAKARFPTSTHFSSQVPLQIPAKRKFLLRLPFSFRDCTAQRLRCERCIYLIRYGPPPRMIRYALVPQWRGGDTVISTSADEHIYLSRLKSHFVIILFTIECRRATIKRTFIDTLDYYEMIFYYAYRRWELFWS